MIKLKNTISRLGFFLFLVAVNTGSSETTGSKENVHGIKTGTTHSGESMAHFKNLYDSSKTLFTSTEHPLDSGQSMLEYIFNQYPSFKYDVGFRWNGKEILCNCTASYCGSKKIIEIFNGFQLPNVCVGLACYHQKRLHQDAQGLIVEDEHMGCYGGEVDTHDHHDQHEPLFCADTPHVNTRCCWHSFCQHTLESFTFPFHEKLELQKLRDKHFWYALTYILIGLAIMMFFCLVGAMYYLIKSKKPQWFFKKIGRKRENVYLMMEIDRHMAAPVNPNLYVPLNNESGTEGDSQGHTLSTTDGCDHPLNHHLVELDESAATAEFSSDLHFIMMQKNSFLGEVVRLAPVGQGRYGTVYKCRWQGQIVAMKVLISRYEQSYFREISMYLSGVLRHTNILQFFGHDMMEHCGAMEMCILFEYHEHGSLDSYLSRNTVDIETATRMIYGMASGLAFLHAPMEPATNRNKPGIAHRDFKSGNVLVKKNLMVCISDLGLSVCHVDGRIGIPKPANKDHFEIEYKDEGKKKEMCGTMRYLAPELLDGSFDWSVFEAYKAADMFSMGLVMYEICRRIKRTNETEIPYLQAMPYFRQIDENGGFVGDVTFDLMKKIVLEENGRPDPSEWWSTNEVLKELQRIMDELWLLDPQCRLTGQNVIRAIERISRKVGLSLEQT